MLAPLVLVAASLDVTAVANPRATDTWVSDGAGMIDAADEARLNELGDELKRTVGLELAIVTVDSVGGPTRPFAVELFNHWGVGDSRFDNGLVFLVAKSERALESVSGDGMRDVLTDAWLKRLQDSTMIPHFKRGSPGAGLVAGVEAVATFLSKEAAGEGAEYSGDQPAQTGEPQPVASRPRLPGQEVPINTGYGKGGSEFPPWGLPVGGAMVLGLAGGGLLWRRKFWRTCRTCKGKNVLLDEAADDSFLEPGQRKEEQIGSVDYDVFFCGACETGMIRSKKKLFSGYRRCPECRFKTRKVVSTTVTAATYSSGGRVRIDEDCKQCSFARTSYRSTPRKQRSSSSSSSGFGGGGSSFGGGGSSGGSYGGGSSSGGGASSSW